MEDLNKIDNPQVETQRQMILAARAKGKGATIKTYIKFSGPGWLQSATTLGGGSLASALYLGVLGGFGFMWLQPCAMILGIIMLASISYITLSIKEKPMDALNKEISPLLGYGWAVGCMIACFVFAMPQFSLIVAALQQNLAQDFFASSPLLAEYGKYILTFGFFALGMLMVAIYSGGGVGIKIFEYFVKISVGMIVVCFFGVTIRLWWENAIDWSKIWHGFVPNLNLISAPSADFMEYIGKLGSEGREYWSRIIVSEQRAVMISAAATAVGINMTFLWPYSILKKKWNKDFRGLAIFDLAIGLFIPYMIATSCIVVAAASEFHAKPAKGLDDSQWALSAGEARADIIPMLALDDASGAWTQIDKTQKPAQILGILKQAETQVPPANLVKPYFDMLDKRIAALIGDDEFKKLSPEARVAKYNSIDAGERAMASMLVKRDAMNLADTLAPLVGEKMARYVFGLGVLGMAANAMLMNMLMCGLSFAEVFGKGARKWSILGSSLIFFSACASLFWEGAKMWLVIHAGVIAMVLLPIASGAFLAIMNSKRILGESAPKGGARFLWNTLIGLSLVGSSVASLYVLYSKLGIWGPAAFFIFLAAIIANGAFKHFKYSSN